MKTKAPKSKKLKLTAEQKKAQKIAAKQAKIEAKKVKAEAKKLAKQRKADEKKAKAEAKAKMTAEQRAEAKAKKLQDKKEVKALKGIKRKVSTSYSKLSQILGPFEKLHKKAQGKTTRPEIKKAIQAARTAVTQAHRLAGKAISDCNSAITSISNK